MIRNGKRQAERQVVRKNGQPRGPWGRGGQLYFALLQRRLLPICLASINELDDDGVSNGPVNIDAVNEALIKHRGGNYKLLPSPPPPHAPSGCASYFLRALRSAECAAERTVARRQRRSPSGNEACVSCVDRAYGRTDGASSVASSRRVFGSAWRRDARAARIAGKGKRKTMSY